LNDSPYIDGNFNTFYHIIFPIGIYLQGIFIIILYMDSRNIVGSRVKQARMMTTPVITQLDLLARLQVLGIKVEQPAISKIESGIRPVSDIEVKALAKALNVTVGWLLGETS
jgi:hypothetical protein